MVTSIKIKKRIRKTNSNINLILNTNLVTVYSISNYLSVYRIIFGV